MRKFSSSLAVLALALAPLATSALADDQVQPPAAASSSSLCTDGRLTILNFELRFRKLLDEIRPGMQDSDPASVINALNEIGRDAAHPEQDTEVCRWNRFFFLDSLIYFDILSKVSPLAPAERPKLLELRNALYAEWMEKVKYGEDTTFAEWESKELRGETLDKFLERGSEHFHSVQAAIKIVYRKPKPPKNQKNIKKVLDYQVKTLLQARTPFSAVTTDLAYQEAARPEVAATVSCVLKALNSFSCDQNVYEQTLACARASGADESRQRALALETLGVFGAQRMYLMRDLKAWMEQNLDQQHFDAIFQVFKDGSQIYFQLENVGNRCGVASVYPKDDGTRPGDHVSVKSYHYWSEAFLTSYLVNQGYPAEESIRAALRPAHMYKSVIRFVGFFYNLLLGTNPLSAETADYKPVIREQEMGARFGASVSQVQN